MTFSCCFAPGSVRASDAGGNRRPKSTASVDANSSILFVSRNLSSAMGRSGRVSYGVGTPRNEHQLTAGIFMPLDLMIYRGTLPIAYRSPSPRARRTALYQFVHQTRSRRGG